MKKISAADFKETETIYMIVVNLSGLHDRIYTLHRSKEDDYMDDMWVESESGDEYVEANGSRRWGWNKEEGRLEYICQNKTLAEGILTTLKLYKKFLIERL